MEVYPWIIKGIKISILSATKYKYTTGCFAQSLRGPPEGGDTDKQAGYPKIRLKR